MDEAALPIFLEVEEGIYHQFNQAKSTFVIQVASGDLVSRSSIPGSPEHPELRRNLRTALASWGILLDPPDWRANRGDEDGQSSKGDLHGQ